MPDPGIAEVAALTAVQENQAATPANRTQRLAREVTRATNDGHFREGLKLHAEARNVDFGGFDRKLAGFGVEIDIGTGARTRTAAENTLATDISAEKVKLTNFFDKGYDGVANKAELRNIIIQQARRNPAMAAQIAALGGNEQAFAERYLRDPAFIAHLKEVVNDNLQGDFDNTVLDAFDEWKEKEDIQTSLQDEIDEINRRKTALEAKKRLFQRDITGVGTGPRAIEIDTLERDTAAYGPEITAHNQAINSTKTTIANLEQELARAKQVEGLGLSSLTSIDDNINDTTADMASAVGHRNSYPRNSADYHSYNTEYEQHKARLALLERQRKETVQAGTPRASAVIEGEITGQKTILQDNQNDVIRKQGEIEKLNSLGKTERDLETEFMTITRQLNQRLEEHRQKVTETSKAKRTYESARDLRLAAETTFRDRIKNASGEAATRTMNDMLQESLQHIDSELTKMKAEEKGEAERAALDAIQARWQTENPVVRGRGPWWNRRTETHRPVNKAQVGEDFDALLNGGDRQLLRDILTGRNNPATNAPYTPAEITSLLDKKEFVDKIGGEAIKQLLAHRLLVGGFRREDVNIITRSAWGGGMLDKAIQSNAQFRSDVEKVMGQNAFNRTGFRERFSQVANERPWLIYSLLGIPFAIRAAIEATPQSEQLQQQAG